MRTTSRTSPPRTPELLQKAEARLETLAYRYKPNGLCTPGASAHLGHHLPCGHGLEGSELHRPGQLAPDSVNWGSDGWDTTQMMWHLSGQAQGHYELCSSPAPCELQAASEQSQNPVVTSVLDGGRSHGSSDL